MKTLGLIAIIAFGFCAFGCDSAPANSSSNNSTPSSVATTASTPIDELAGGRALYNQSCAACHKEDGTGGKMTIEGRTIKPDDLTSDKMKNFSDDKIIGYIYDGVEDDGMPAFKDKLAEAQIREIVSYIRRGLQKIEPLPSR